MSNFVYKDGVWILRYGHVNSTELRVVVCKNNKQIELIKFPAVPGENQKEDVLKAAHEFANKYGLPIINGTGAGWSSFRDEYTKSDLLTFNDPDIEDYEYSDEDIDSMDSRESKTIKWAICQGPNLFKIYDNVQKNPSKFWDTRMFRGLGGYNLDTRIPEFESFFEEHAEDVYEGTWEDLKDGDYTILVHNRIYESQHIKYMFDKIVSAGLIINGNSIQGELNIEHEEDLIRDVAFNFSKNKFASYMMSDKKLISVLETVYDCLTCMGGFFPEEFTISFSDANITAIIHADDTISTGYESTVISNRNLNIGDVIMYGYPREQADDLRKYIIVGKDKKTLTTVRCSEHKEISKSKYYGSMYKEKFNWQLYERALDGNYSEDDTRDFLITDYKVLLWHTAEDILRLQEKGYLTYA